MSLHASWQHRLGESFQTPEMVKLKQFLQQEQAEKRTIYPKMSQVFRALDLTPFEHTKVVLVGQDPYHGPNQAEGLCFSVPKGQQLPPSLVNIYKELQSDLNIQPPSHGSLTSWAQEGVLLLNTSLTVRAGEPASHSDKGWEFFTDHIIRKLSDEKDYVVFLLFGRHAHQKEKLIDVAKHGVIKEAHPSPLSAHRGFFGSKPFSRTNQMLQEHGLDPINWAISG